MSDNTSYTLGQMLAICEEAGVCERDTSKRILRGPAAVLWPAIEELIQQGQQQPLKAIRHAMQISGIGNSIPPAPLPEEEQAAFALGYREGQEVEANIQLVHTWFFGGAEAGEQSSAL